MKYFNNQKGSPRYRFGEAGVAHILALILLLLGLGAGIYLVTQTQIFNPKASDPNANLSQGLVGYWKFDETAGNTVADSSGNNNTGTWQGTLGNQWSQGKFGNAGSFNGSNNTVVVTNNPLVALTKSLTISAWAQRGNTVKSSYGILTKGNVSSASNNASYGLFLSGSDQYALRVSNTGTNPVNISTNKTYPSINVWDHIVGVYTSPSQGVSAPVGSQGTLDIYINGVSAGKQITNAPLSLFNNTANVTIGSETTDGGIPTWFWNGALDEVRLYNRALSASEVFQLYNYNPNAGSGISSPVSPNPTPSIAPSPIASPSTTPTPSPAANSKRVFVTSTKYNGNLGGISGADAKCQERATAANLGGTWKAWISGSQSNSAPSQRFAKATVPYTLIDGTVIANNWTDLITMKPDGSFLRKGIDLTELGTKFSPTVWTATQFTGSPTTSQNAYTCIDWVWGGKEASGYIGLGGFSSGGGIPGFQWTATGGRMSCNNNYALYCFEQ